MSDTRTSLGVADKRQSAYPARFEIMPTMELMAGVLSQTSWMRRRGLKRHGNEYFQALSRFMEPYRDHRAIHITESALSKGLTYDAPCAFICHFGLLPEMPRLYDYGGSLSFRNLDPAMLDDLHDSLVELAELSRFTDFFEGWRDRLERMGECFSNDVDVSTIIDLLTDFFGWEQQTRPILAPAMFPGEAMGITRRQGRVDGRRHSHRRTRRRHRQAAVSKRTVCQGDRDTRDSSYIQRSLLDVASTEG